MACPFFHPLAALPAEPEQRHVPLGDFYCGECRAGEIPYMPSETEQREWCNFGYARGHCAHFPAMAGPDAVRFAVTEGGMVRFVFEREYRPYAHGEFYPPHPDAALNRLAEAFLESRARRINER